MIFLFLVCIVTLSFIIILFPRLLVSLSTKALFICYFVFYCKQLVNLSTRLLVNFKLVKTKKPWREAKVSAVRTRLELVTSCVTGRHSNQLN